MRAALLACAASAVAVALPAGASAYFAPGAQIVSVSPEKREQADDSTGAVDISDDGRYVVFQTRARNLFEDGDPDPPGQFRVGGIFRRDLQTGALELVAPGELRNDSTPEAIAVRGAANPSVSADGRYVAFSTGWQHSAADTNGNVDVYVRDMTRPIGDTSAFEMVSARDGASTGASWGAPADDHPGRNPGAEVTAAGSISADGRRVIFRTQASSNLPAVAGVTTPALQLFVRDRQTQATTLVTRVKVTSAPAGGAISNAVISGDGSAAVWVAREAPAQAEFLPGELNDGSITYYLYRRLDGGSSAPTRRITGAVDLDDPACSPSTVFVDDPLRTGSCYGPLGFYESAVGTIAPQIPAVSADGWRVAFLTASHPRATLPTGSAADLFVANLSPGLSRKGGTEELTREALGIPESQDPIDGVAMSADGRWLVISTFRRAFTLPALRLEGSARANGAARELYLVDLQQRRVERVIRGWRENDSDGSAGQFAAVDASGRRIAFLSGATNLFHGDANGRIDAFVASRTDAPPAEPEPEPLPELPLTPAPEPEPGPVVLPLSARATAARAGRVRIVVTAPVKGDVSVVVRGRLPGANGRPTGRAQTLASLEKKLRKAGRATLELPIRSRYRRSLQRAGRITGTAEVVLSADDGREYRRVVTVQFR